MEEKVAAEGGGCWGFDEMKVEMEVFFFLFQGEGGGGRERWIVSSLEEWNSTQRLEIRVSMLCRSQKNRRKAR